MEEKNDRAIRYEVAIKMEGSKAGHGDPLSQIAFVVDKCTSFIYGDNTLAQLFWILGTTCLIAEPILVAYSMNQQLYNAQITIFSMSSLHFLMQTIGLLFKKKPWKTTVEDVICFLLFYTYGCDCNKHFIL